MPFCQIWWLLHDTRITGQFILWVKILTSLVYTLRKRRFYEWKLWYDILVKIPTWNSLTYPWHLPLFRISLTLFHIPWQFPDLEKNKMFPDVWQPWARRRRASQSLYLCWCPRGTSLCMNWKVYDWEDRLGVCRDSHIGLGRFAHHPTLASWWCWHKAFGYIPLVDSGGPICVR